MKIGIMAAGPNEFIPELKDLDWIEQGMIWIGVDRGVLILMDQGVFPQIGIGDFDSVSEEEMAIIDQNVRELQTARAEKDETDMELALSLAVKHGATDIYILGATGGRRDHELANVHLLVKTKKQSPSCSVTLIDRQNEISISLPGEYEIKQNKHQYLSFLPVSEKVHGITLKGVKYELNDRNISLGSTLCISNELIQPTGTFSFVSGIIMMIRSSD